MSVELADLVYLCDAWRASSVYQPKVTSEIFGDSFSTG